MSCFTGGILVLEAQSYSSYSKKKKLTPRIFENFQSIQFLPEQFSEYLLHEVGFTTSHVIAVPRHASKGFQRPIQVRILVIVSDLVNSSNFFLLFTKSNFLYK